MRSSIIFPVLVLGATASPMSRLNNPLLRRQDICSGYEFSSGDAGKDSTLWDKTGAGKFLSDFITKNGVTDWTDHFFQQVVAGGTRKSHFTSELRSLAPESFKQSTY